MSTEMSGQLVKQLAAAFSEHMIGNGEAALLQAVALGRSAQAAQRDALELLTVQQEALITVLLARVSAEERARLLEVAVVFTESLASAIQLPRGAWDSATLPRLMNAELRRQLVQQTADLRQANVILRESDAWLQELINTTQDALVTIDRQGRIEHFNPAAERMFGYTQAEAVGQKVQLLMPEPYASEHDGYLARYECTGERHAIGRIRAVAARRKNGEVFPVELSVTEINVGEEVRYGAFLRDISEKVKLQERLIEKERLAAIGSAAAKLTHEIGNPLNGMSLATQLLELRLGELKADEAVRQSVGALNSQIMRLSHLLHEFNALSRRQRLILRPTNLSELVRDVLTAELPLYLQQGVAVEQRLAPELPMLQIDQDKLKQVVLNLCKNAVEAMPDGGTLTVRVANSGKQVRVEVSDTGGGIPEGVNIFEPFVTTKEKGTGLGLPIVRQLVDAHGGALTYTSTPGKGATFVVALPLQRKDV